MENQRLLKELEDLEKDSEGLNDIVRDRKSDLTNKKETLKNMEGEVRDLRDLVDASKIWVDSAMRIALQRDTVNQKESDYQQMNCDDKGRDLKQVEAALLDNSSKKDEYTDKITKVNFILSLFLYSFLLCNECFSNSRLYFLCIIYLCSTYYTVLSW